MKEKSRPSKAIKQKNQEGYGLIDFVCPADERDPGNFPNIFDNLFNDKGETFQGNYAPGSDVSSCDESALEESSTVTALQPQQEPDVETSVKKNTGSLAKFVR